MCQLIKPKEEIFNRFVLLLKREQLPSQPCPLVPLSCESMNFLCCWRDSWHALFACVSPKSRAEFGVIRVVLSRINSLGCFVLPGAGLSWEGWLERLAVTFGRAGEGSGVLGCGVWAGSCHTPVPLSLGCPGSLGMHGLRGGWFH